MNPPRLPRWVPITLILAGVYNLTWSVWMSCFPLQSIQLVGYPIEGVSLWQGIGVLVGVFGIGYAIAALNPVRHWLVVFLGLISKVLAGAGAVGAALTGSAPPMAGWLALPNDIIWWFPFLAVLWAVFKFENEAPSQSGPTLSVDEGLTTIRSQTGQTLAELSSERPLLVVFLRHAGCTFCREAFSDIAKQRTEIEGRGTGIAFVSLNGFKEIEPILSRHGVADLPCFSDRDEQLYRAFELRSGTVSTLFSPSVALRGIQALFAGHGVGALKANGFRLGGTFLLKNGQVIQGERFKTSADRPNYCELIQPAN